MCAILDADCLNEVFGRKDRPESGEKFLEWLEKQGTLVIGGKLRDELGKSNRFLRWYQQAVNSGLVINFDDNHVNETADNLTRQKSCISNDTHIIALAQVSNARLLYSYDVDLHTDFGNSNLIQKPRGKIYSTNRSSKFSAAHRRLLSNRNLCRK